MRFFSNRNILLFLMICIGTGCANMVPPSGGNKDVKPPKLVSTNPPDSQLHIKPKKIELRFDEYITLTDANIQVQISPILSIQPVVSSVNKKVMIKIADTLLQDNTTYRISFGNAIRDLHEGNEFKGYTYTFSTGAYFDSLQLDGTVLSAVTGLPDTGNILVVLYNASESDSSVVKKKPLYVTVAATNGAFSFKGLPARSFKIYALKDYNGNLIYDGASEWIGFFDNTVKAGDYTEHPIELRVFQEAVDTSKNKSDTVKKAPSSGLQNANKPAKSKEGFEYSLIDIDTSNVRSRTKDITKPVEISFNKHVATLTHERISLTYDSEGVSIPATFVLEKDTIRNRVKIKTNWQENTVYTLKLLKGFAKDTGGADAMPSKYIFRTKRDEDYAKLHIHISPKYLDKQYILLVKNDKDTVYQKSITDTIVHLQHLAPNQYTTMIIVDKNGNGKWDAGKLFEKLQPEQVIPYGNPVPLKAGWENTIDMPPATNNSKSKWGKDVNMNSK